MKGPIYFSALFCLPALILSACTHPPKNTLFTQLRSDQSGIHFTNQVNDVDSATSFINEFGYMGGGVGIGDFNNDGLKDIFFSANQVSCRLYINKGNNQFEDITERAGVTTDVWATGVSVADVNNDGYDDIYVCVLGKDLLHPARNLLFINQHNLTFKEEAEQYGLAFSGYSTQAVFLDYDRDGDLDMYLVNYLLGNNSNSIVPRNMTGGSPANDRLFRNDGYSAAKGHPVFTDVTLQAGIKDDGFGLGVAVSDYNGDGWPDIYVADDFISNDLLWLNNHDGTFTNCISKALQHQSYSSMGADAADVNNDGLPDLVTLDMLPEYNRRRKESFSFMNYDRYQAERGMGYEPELMRNMLQINNGSVRAGGAAIPYFSEIGQLAGVQATDWSWSVLLADFNNDGWKDMHITNGIGRDFINADFLEFSSKIFNSGKSKAEQQALIRKRLAELDHVNLSNYLYLNQHDYGFADASAMAGIDEPSMSNGAVYADLDNDGDLDLVVNNINKEAFVFINNTVQKGKPVDNHFLSLGLVGDTLNRRGFGARVCVYSGGMMQMQEENPVRGYFSSVDRQLLFGLGKSRHIDSITVLWPDSSMQEILNIHADTFLTLSWQDAAKGRPPLRGEGPVYFTELGSSSGIVYRHRENIFNDFAMQRLLPHKYSQLGPFVATGDIDGDGAVDFFVGGATGESGKIFLQGTGGTRSLLGDQRARRPVGRGTPELAVAGAGGRSASALRRASGRDASELAAGGGRSALDLGGSGGLFVSRDLVDSGKMEEDMGSVLFDANGDGVLDLLVTGGDIQYEDSSIYYKPRLYMGDGKGNFSLLQGAIPDGVRTSAGCVAVGDLDGDGDPDVFIGGRVSGQYPLSPRSYILRNNKGVFTDVTAEVCPALQKGGMITSAVWADIDNDKQADLVVAGEWMPVRWFKNDRGVLHERTDSMGLTGMHGMWRSLIATDIDNDGDIDLVAGNLGLNCDYRVSAAAPMDLYAADIDGNGRIDPVLFYYIKDADGVRRSYPAFSRAQLAMQVPGVKKKFLLNDDYARAGFEDIFPGKSRSDVLHFYCDETRSCWFENTGNGRFAKHPLPVEAQFAPVNAIICEDIDNDGYKDLLLAGNDYQTDVITGRYDASYGCFLRGSNKGEFMAVPPEKSGFVLKGDVRDMALIRLAKGKRIVVAAVNDDSVRVFRVN